MLTVATLVLVLALALALYALWHVRYGHPPEDLPPVLCFHKLSRRFCFEGTWTTPSRFVAVVDRLLDRGYTFLTESHFLDAVASLIESAAGPVADPPPRAPRAGDPRLSATRGGGPRSVFLTFDDGYEEVFTEAFPALSARGIPFHVFLVTDYAGRTNAWDLSLGRRSFRHLSWDAVREMMAHDVTFGSHTASHGDLTRLRGGDLAGELERSKQAIERETGARVRTLSYPFGRYDEAVKRAAATAGYEAAFSLYPPHANSCVDRYALRRNGVYVIDPVRAIEVKLTRHPLFGLEEMKCRTINAVSVLTPLFKRYARPG